MPMILDVSDYTLQFDNLIQLFKASNGGQDHPIAVFFSN